jgi:hypothetical protein
MLVYVNPAQVCGSLTKHAQDLPSRFVACIINTSILQREKGEVLYVGKWEVVDGQSHLTVFVRWVHTTPTFSC